MNIFATSECPEKSAIVLPDMHIKKMPIECCQMLAFVASKTYRNYGTIPKKDGSPYLTTNKAHLVHPCTIWAAQSIHNATWLLYHGFMLCEEYELRFKKKIACYDSLLEAAKIFPEGDLKQITPFARAMPDELKFDKTIDTFTAYKKYLLLKEWPSDNYKKIPSRKPDWL